ncbi:hypothetical protein RJ640_006865 [Escallonia rubra]|uniref:NADH dehydrogenase [ubiquinone] iron-sulfur protein 4, mitochondrial n=1 Tax=Escallonia rubra TaxID=112253 RepID=A0AA88RE02_9ASTE|nr:hypothetical protein RJ640_006865 [Escallonia rubra]
MASSICRGFISARAHRSTALLSTRRSFSSDALVETKPGEVGIISGIPEQHLRRRIIGVLNNIRSLWENPLMGWTSTGDPYANVGEAGLSFDSEEAAKEFAEKHGWDYMVKKPQTPLLKPKSYADNFKWRGPPMTEGA